MVGSSKLPVGTKHINSERALAMSRNKGPEKAQIRLRVAKELADYATGEGALWLEAVIRRARVLQDALGGAKADVPPEIQKSKPAASQDGAADRADRIGGMGSLVALPPGRRLREAPR